MTYDSRGDLVELEVSGESKNEQIYEKANFYKNSDFVTKSKFTHNGILTKHNFTTKKPPHNSKFTFDSDFPSYSVIHSLFHKGPEHFPTSLVFDDVAPVQSFINSTYDIFKYPQKFETTRQRPTIAFYTTPAPTSIIPIIVTQPTNNNKKSNKKTKTKKTPQTPVTSDIHEHIMKNLEYYKKLLNVNCTFKGPQNENRIEENETVEVTPRPTKIAVNDKDIHEKDKSKKKCDCKHHHGHHHQKHSHEKHSHENYKPAVVLHKPSAIQPVYVQSHKLPEIQTHFHHHQSSKGNSGIEVADNAALFDSTGKLPPLGVEYNEVGNIFDTIEGLLSTNNNNKDTDDVDYESRDESGSDYSESIEEEHEGVEESSESDYEDDDKRKRRKREIFGGKNHNYSRQHVEGRVGGKVELLNERLKRKIAPPQLSSNFSHDVITTRSRSIPSDFMEMISHMFSPSTKSDAPIKLLSSAIKKKYNNFQLWRIQTSKKSEISYLDELRMSSEGRKLHWLESPRLFSFTDVVVAPEHLESFKKFLAKGNINFNLKLRNVQNAIRFENFRLNRREQVEGEIMNGHPLTFYRYHPSKDIIAYYDFIKRKYPTFVELITIGFTFHSKPIFCIKVSAPKLQQQPKPGVFILAGVSSHLWLPVSSSLNILDNIVKNLANNDSLGEYIRKYDWFVLSLLNVDGYDYSMAFDRLWRKTRSEYTIDDSSGLMSMPFSWFRTSENESDCYGVDARSNFDVKWKRSDFTAGDDKCSDFYSGPFAKSEQEVKHLSSFLQKNNKHIKLFINLDGYGPLISFPTSNLKRKSLDDIQEIAKAGLRNLKTHRSEGKRYMIKKDILSSSPEGYAMHIAKIKYSYRIDSMESRQTSFFVPATSIQKNSNDIFDIVKGMTKKLGL